MKERKRIRQDVRTAVLTEAGYRCAVPRCGTILALDLHHILALSDGGSDDPANLVALCPTCHALFHRGEIKEPSVRIWKATIAAAAAPFDRATLELLRLLDQLAPSPLVVGGDGLLPFATLITRGLVRVQPVTRSQGSISRSRSGAISGGYLGTEYHLHATDQGTNLLCGWLDGDPAAMQS